MNIVKKYKKIKNETFLELKIDVERCEYCETIVEGIYTETEGYGIILGFLDEIGYMRVSELKVVKQKKQVPDEIKIKGTNEIPDTDTAGNIVNYDSNISYDLLRKLVEIGRKNNGYVSISLIQRSLSVGFFRAYKLFEFLTDNLIVEKNSEGNKHKIADNAEKIINELESGK